MTDYSFIDKWYGDLVPNNFEGLIEFTILSSQLTEDIYRLKPGIDSQSNTAYVKNDICFLPAMYYIDKYYDEIFIDKQDRVNNAISIINGSQIHEAIKIKDLGKKFNYEDKRSKILDVKQYRNVTANNNNVGLFYRCFVLIEELFCDAYCEYYYPNVYPFVDLMNKSLYNEKFASNILGNIKIDNSNHLLIGFNMFRNWDNVSKPGELSKWPKFKDALNILTSAKNPDLTLNEKFNLAYDLYELIKENTKSESNYQNELTSKETGEMIDKQSVIIWDDTFSENELLDVFKEFEHGINDDEKIDVELVNVSGYNAYYNSLENASEFEGFANYLKNARAEKQISQFPKMYGNRLLPNRLMYAHVDGSIFGKKDSTRLIKGYPEIIFLLDFSGSMKGGGLFKRVIEVGKTIFYDLQQNNINCAFYGHTTNDNKCLVIAIAAHNMPLMELNRIEQTANFEQAFTKATGVSCHENADGYALEFVAQKFTDKPGKKLVVVASDGYPSFCHRNVNYGGVKAEKHVESVANLIRESNISVVALSLTEDVVSTNDKIYGKEHNYQAFGQNLENNLKKIVKELVI